MRTYIPHNSKYLLDKQRYLELKAFARQYKKLKADLNNVYGLQAVNQGGVQNPEPSDPTERAAEAALKISTKIDMIERAAMLATPYYPDAILLNVTEGLSYEALERKGKKPPCGVNQFYEARQRFYFELDKLRE